LTTRSVFGLDIEKRDDDDDDDDDFGEIE